MKRNKFSLSHYRLITAEMGTLIPVNCIEVIPGDTIQQSTSMLIRVTPLLAPVMHPVQAIVHHFFVPHRLVWKDFEDFITGGPDGMDSSVFPTLEYDLRPEPENGTTLPDYFGLPVGYGVEGNYLQVSALPFRAYALIYNEYYRDQDLQDPLDISLESGPDTITNQELMRTSWAKDYFTSARPWPQKGPDVTIPIGLGQQQVTVTGPQSSTSTPWTIQKDGVTYGMEMKIGGDSSGPYNVMTSSTGLNPDLDAIEYPLNLQQNTLTSTGTLDLSAAGSLNLDDLREAVAIQKFEEARAMYGSRYTEYLRYYGIRAQDSRLQRPEYLGGGRQMIQFSEVLATDSESLGKLGGHGIGAMRTNRYRRFIPEHGYIISLMTVRPKSIYTQPLERHWSRRIKEDFYTREFANLGDQAILVKELHCRALEEADDEVFGYQGRYDEYRRQQSMALGLFRTEYMNHWHMAREFDDYPVLNSSFISCVPTKRVYAEQNLEPLWCMIRNSVQARRPITRNATPKIF